MGVAGDLPPDNRELAQANIRKVARQFLRNDINKRPMIIPVILDT
jgi:mRNA degradation ribonuclease J1/J2